MMNSFRSLDLPVLSWRTDRKGAVPDTHKKHPPQFGDVASTAVPRLNRYFPAAMTSSKVSARMKSSK